VLLALPVAAPKAVDPTRGAAKAEPCMACHGSGERAAQAGVPLLAGQQREFLVLQMFYLREGLRDVPEMADMFKGYVDRDLEDVAAYYNSQPLPRIESTSNPALLRKGADLSRAMGCGSCHLANYRGQKHVPRIAGQREDYLVTALKAYRDNKRTGTDTSMNAAMYRVTDAEIEALAHYLAQQ
jgi:cytochrome c553